MSTWSTSPPRRGAPKLDDIFLRLALQFDHYRERLSLLARQYLFT